MNTPETVGDILSASDPNAMAIPPYIKIYQDLMQGSDAWHRARNGILTASKTSSIITAAKLDYSSSKDAKAIVCETAVERITGYIQDEYQSYAMARGKDEEILAYNLYHEKIAPLHTVGFITNARYGGGILIGCSPDGLTQCGQGMIEVKSKANHLHLKIVCDDEMPSEFSLQVQTALLVTERKWCDFISYSNGMPMFVKRVLPDLKIQEKIVEAAIKFDADVEEMCDKYGDKIAEHKFIPTPRRIEDISA